MSNDLLFKKKKKKSKVDNQTQFNLEKGCFPLINIVNYLQNYNKSIWTMNLIIQNKFPCSVEHEKPGTGRLAGKACNSNQISYLGAFHHQRATMRLSLSSEYTLVPAYKPSVLYWH